jgi:hypothetical protein
MIHVDRSLNSMICCHEQNHQQDKKQWQQLLNTSGEPTAAIIIIVSINNKKKSHKNLQESNGRAITSRNTKINTTPKCIRRQTRCITSHFKMTIL